jgi:acetolactate synthase small subunit
MFAPQSSPSYRTPVPHPVARSVADTAAAGGPTYCFSVQAAADPGLLLRVLELFAKRNLVPTRCHAVLTGPERDELLIDLQVAGLGLEEAEHVARSLRQLVFVASVLTCITDGQQRLERSA